MPRSSGHSAARAAARGPTRAAIPGSRRSAATCAARSSTSPARWMNPFSTSEMRSSADPHDVRSEHHHAGGHPLEHRVRERIRGRRRVDQGVCRPREGTEVFRLGPAQKPDGIRHAQVRGQRAQSLAVWPRPRHRVSEGLAGCCGRAGQRTDRHVVPLQPVQDADQLGGSPKTELHGRTAPPRTVSSARIAGPARTTISSASNEPAAWVRRRASAPQTAPNSAKD